MRPKHTKRRDQAICSGREFEIINMEHECSCCKIDWEWLDGEIAPLYSDQGGPGRPASGFCC